MDGSFEIPRLGAAAAKFHVNRNGLPQNHHRKPSAQSNHTKSTAPIELHFCLVSVL
jgi:hypothetical protein